MVSTYATIDDTGVVTNIFISDDAFAQSMKAFLAPEGTRIGGYFPGLEPIEVPVKEPTVEVLEEPVEDTIEAAVTEPEEVLPIIVPKSVYQNSTLYRLGRLRAIV